MDLTTINLKSELLQAAKAYCKRHGTTLGALGKKMVNDRKFFVDMERSGRGCNIDTFERLIRELSNDLDMAIPKEALNNTPALKH